MQQKNEIRILFFADTHLGFDYPIRPKIERRRRGQDFFDNYLRILKHAADSKMDLVVHGGDLFFRSRLPQKIIDLAYEPLFEFAEHGIPFLIVPGNHERSELPVSLYLTHSNIHVFEKPKTLKFDLAGICLAMVGFPFERNDIRNRFKSILAKSGWNDDSADIRLLCMHQAVEGAQVGPSNYTFRYGRDVIKMTDIPTDFLAILTGHIHRQQILRKPLPDARGEMPIIYPGATERTSFAEKSENKGYFEIQIRRGDDDNWQIHQLNFIKLPTRPMVDLILDNNVDKSNLKSYILAEISKFNPNAIVRIKFDKSVNDSVSTMLTSQFLRDIFPASMNFQFSSDFNTKHNSRFTK